MSRQGRQELVTRLLSRYLKSTRTEKSNILDEFVAVSALHRKAVGALRHGYQGYKCSAINSQWVRGGEQVAHERRLWHAEESVANKKDLE